MADKNVVKKTSSPEEKNARKGPLSSFSSLFNKNEEKKSPKGNVFTEVKKEGDKNEADTIIDSIVSQTEEDRSVLGPKPSSPKFPVKEKPPLGYQSARFVFQILTLISLGVFVFFFYQLNTDYNYLSGIIGDNLAQELTNSNNEIIDVQTGINADRYLVTKLKLDHFLILSEPYLYKQDEIDSVLTADTGKNQLEKEVEELDQEIRDVLKTVKENLAEPLYLNLPGEDDSALESRFKEALRNYLREEKEGLRKKLGQEELKKEVFEEMKNYDAVLALLSNNKIKEMLKEIDVENKLDPAKVEELAILTNEINRNEFSVIAQIKTDSVKWSEVIDDIERITKKIDPLFRHAELSDIGEISYRSYAFNKKDQKIQISGETRREDNRNFTLIANLIDAFEDSPEFQQVDARSFSKSEQENKSVASLSLLMLRQWEEETPEDTEENGEKPVEEPE